MSKEEVVGQAHAIVADALLAEAILQEKGEIRRLGEAYESTHKRVLEMEPNYGEAVAFAFTF